MRVHSIKNVIRGVYTYTRWFSSVRNTLVWTFGCWGMLFLSAPALRAQNTGKWEAINSSGTAVASGPTLDVSQFSGDIGAATASCISNLPQQGVRAMPGRSLALCKSTPNSCFRELAPQRLSPSYGCLARIKSLPARAVLGVRVLLSGTTLASSVG